MRTIVALFVLIGVAPLFGQYAPPARDLDESVKYVEELTRQLEPALKEAREQAVVFGLIARMHQRLAGKEPASEISDAKKMIDDFLEQRERAGVELSRDNQKTLKSVRQELELAQPPYSVPALRERLHHEFVHPLELEALRDLQSLEHMEMSWEILHQRLIDPLRKSIMSGVQVTAQPVKNN